MATPLQHSTGNGSPPRTLTGVRQSNLSEILTLVHRYGPLRRSDIAEKTGLNRSTVLALVNELQAKNLVVEEHPTGSGEVGRPSIEVRSADGIVSFVVIPRLGEITIGTVALGGRVVNIGRQPLPPGVTPEEAAQLAGTTINALRADLPPGTRIAGIGVAAPGQVHVGTSELRLGPSLGWRETPLAKILHQHTNLPVRLDNDASLACGAEKIFGAGRDHDNMVFLIGVPGGVGGGAVIRGELLRGHLGYAGEFGHMRISDSDTPDYSQLPGTLESLVRHDQLLDVVGLTENDEDKLFAALQDAHTQPKVSRLLDTHIHYLARGISNLLIALNPEVVVLSGFLEHFLALRKDQLLEEIRQQTLPYALEGVDIRPGSLGTNLLPVGTAELSFHELLGDPLGCELTLA